MKKSNGRVYGAELTAAEKRALDMEARRQLAEYTRLHQLEIEAMVIRHLREVTGWGERRLRRFYDGFDSEIDSLVSRYEMSSEDAPWLCTRQLLEDGFDIEAWHKQTHPNERYEVG